VADLQNQDALRKRYILPHCDFLFPNCRLMPSLRSEPRTTAQASYEKRNHRQSAHDSSGCTDDRFGVRFRLSMDTEFARVRLYGTSPFLLLLSEHR
jgi:hypothetical protein